MPTMAHEPDSGPISAATSGALPLAILMPKEGTMPYDGWLVWKTLTTLFIGGPVALFGLMLLYQAYRGRRK